MRKMRKLTAILLAMCMMLTLAACNEEQPVASSTPTVPTTTAPTEGTTLPAEETASEIFDRAQALRSGASDLQLQVSMTQSMTVAGETYTTSSLRDITYLGLNTDGFTAMVEENNEYAGYYTEISETWADGMVYSTVYGSSFCSPMTAEEFLSRNVPIDMLDTALYAASEVTETADGTTLTFSQPAALESWLTDDAAVLTDASAEVTLDTAGELQVVYYQASYTLGGGTFETSVKVTYSIPGQTISFKPAADTEYTEVEYIDGGRVLEQVYGYLLGATNVSSSQTNTMQVEAAGYYLSFGYTVDSYGSGSGLLSKVETSVYSYDYYNNETATQDMEELYKNSKYTVSTDGGSPVTNRSVTADVMTEYIQGILVEYIYDCGYFEGITCTDLGSLLLIEFTGSEELGQLYNETVNYYTYSDSGLLDSYASKYKTETMEYYVAIDKYLGLPTAVGINFEGVHTIDGYEYHMTYQADQSFYLASMDAYKEVMEVSTPDVEPENKATPLFYHVTGPDGQEMWLLGTIHIGDDRTGYLPQEIYDAFNASSALAVECDTDSFYDQVEEDETLSEAVSDCYYLSDGSTAADHLSAELYELAKKMMKATGNYFANAEYLTPSMWENSISNFFSQQGYKLSSDKGVEERLMKLASDSNKTVLEVESCLFQLQMLTGWSDALVEEMLWEAVETDTLEYNSSLIEMYELWCSGDEAALIEYLKDDLSDMTEEELALYNEYNNAMLIDRNANIAKVAISYLESGDTVFYAVGLAHVIGEHGLVEALREAGYTVELVQYQ